MPMAWRRGVVHLPGTGAQGRHSWLGDPLLARPSQTVNKASWPPGGADPARVVGLDDGELTTKVYFRH